MLIDTPCCYDAVTRCWLLLLRCHDMPRRLMPLLPRHADYCCLWHFQRCRYYDASMFVAYFSLAADDVMLRLLIC